MHTVSPDFCPPAFDTVSSSYSFLPLNHLSLTDSLYYLLTYLLSAHCLYCTHLWQSLSAHLAPAVSHWSFFPTTFSFLFSFFASPVSLQALILPPSVPESASPVQDVVEHFLLAPSSLLHLPLCSLLSSLPSVSFSLASSQDAVEHFLPPGLQERGQAWCCLMCHLL